MDMNAIKVMLVTQALALFIWMAKDIFNTERSQIRKSTENIGAIHVTLAKLKSDIDAAHAAIRALRGQKREGE